jgi:hypothetical protein
MITATQMSVALLRLHAPGARSLNWKRTGTSGKLQPSCGWMTAGRHGQMSETKEQITIVQWYRAQYPQYALSLRVSQSGGYKGKGRQGAIRMAQIKAQGGVTGESDIAILLKRGDFGCLLIEYKADESVKGATSAQLEYIRYHNSIGNCACVAKGMDMCMAAIKQYMELGEIRMEITDIDINPTHVTVIRK